MRKKTESYIKPQKWHMVISEGTAYLTFAENIEKVVRPVKKSMFSQRKQTAEQTETETVYIYDRYALTVPNRDSLLDDVSENPDKWLQRAKQNEYDKLADEVRKARNKLLAECDADFMLDRINLDIPDNVTASTMLNSVKNIFNKLSSVCNSEMAKYRQALRDIPQQEGFPYDVKYPIKPND